MIRAARELLRQLDAYHRALGAVGPVPDLGRRFLRWPFRLLPARWVLSREAMAAIAAGYSAGWHRGLAVSRATP